MGAAMVEAMGQAWPPFVLVAGLLLIGVVVEADGVFVALGVRVERIRGGPIVLLATLLGLEAVVAAVLNLDTAVVFLTPILVHAARQRGCDERPFLYGALMMANGASLLLPGSNLTNLIVLAHEPLTGREFARAMLLPWLVVILVTIAFLAIVYRPRVSTTATDELPVLHLGLGAGATAAATLAMLALHNPALPVLAIGVTAVGARRLRPTIGVTVLVALFALAVALGTLAREWDAPGRLVAKLGGVGVAALGATTSVLVNNLPAATLLSARRPPHPLPLLIGLNLGPNLAVTGSLAAYLWYKPAHTAGARPSFKHLSGLGFALVPLTIAAALCTLALTDATAF